jgi:hypothetical protein
MWTDKFIIINEESLHHFDGDRFCPCNCCVCVQHQQLDHVLQKQVESQ